MQKHQQNFHLETELMQKNLWCLRLPFKDRDCLSRDYGLECLQGISDNIPTLTSHGMKFIKIFIIVYFPKHRKLEVYQ